MKLKIPDPPMSQPVLPPEAPLIQPTDLQGPRIETEPSKSAEELLRDPLDGKIFLPYFREIKTRIQSKAEYHRRFIFGDRGKVTLDFVLNREGGIVSMKSYPDRKSRGNPLLVSRALQILRDAEPFRRFPDDLNVPSVAFNITLVFGDEST